MVDIPGLGTDGAQTVRVEPKKTASGVMWSVETGRMGGGQRYNYKDDATKAARKKAKSLGAELVVKNTDLSVSERRDYS